MKMRQILYFVVPAILGLSSNKVYADNNLGFAAENEWRNVGAPPEIDVNMSSSGFQKYIAYFDGLVNLRLLDGGQIQVKRSITDGKVSFDEYILFVNSDSETTALGLLDKNCDKNVDEFGMCVNSARNALILNQIKNKLFDPLDLNHDGYISLEDKLVKNE